MFDDFKPQDFKHTGPRLSGDAGYAFVDGAQGAKSILDGGPADAVYNHHNATVDVLFNVRGFSAEAAFHGRKGADPLRQFAEVGTGYDVQPGYLLPGLPVVLARRWGPVMPLDGSALSEKTEVGPAVSYYLNGARNKMKLQADYLRAWGDDPALGENPVRVPLQAMR